MSNSTTPSQVLTALESHGYKITPTTKGWKSICPAHSGKSQSLSIDNGATGAVLLHCFSGCEYLDVLRALGLGEANGAKRIVATYDYDGFFETVRYSPKAFKQRRKTASGEWAWNLKGVALRLYRQDDLAAARAAEVFVVEGEKDCETLRKHDLLAVTNHGGATKWRAAHTKALVAAGVKSVVVFPDADEPGREHGAKVAAACSAAGLGVKVVELPAKDVSAYLDVYGDKAGLLKLAAAAQEWTAPAKAKAIPEETSEPAGGPTENTVALAFTDKYRDTLRYCPDLRRWFEWDKARWRPDKLARAFHYARTLAGESSTARTVQKAAFARGVESFCQSDPTHAVAASYWDAEPMKLGTPGGTVDLDDGRVLAALPVDGITKLTAVAPGKSGECPRWLQFLDESTGSDEQLVSFLHRWFGYCLTGSTQEQALIFLYGGGGNGKTVFLNVLSGVLGDYATTASMDVLTASKYDRHPTELAALAGARVVVASETDEGRVWAESRIKLLTGGDKISARFMRQDPFEFQPAFKLAIAANTLPTLHNCGAAMRRRFHLVPFDRVPETPDLELGETLRREWPGILAWAVAGCALWRQEGLGTAARIESETDAYFAESDHFGAWLEAECELCEPSEGYEFAGELFKSWAKYLAAIKEPEETATKFGRRLRGLGLKKEKSGTVRWYGIKLSGMDSLPM